MVGKRDRDERCSCDCGCQAPVKRGEDLCRACAAGRCPVERRIGHDRAMQSPVEGRG
jgi:hypothetical protein